MKIIIEGDKHVGTKKDDPYIANAIELGSRFLCDYAKKHGITTLIQTGDWFDTRSGLTQETLKFQRETITPMYEDAFDLRYVILGNHDMHLKDAVTPNSIFEVFGDRDNWFVIQEPTTICIGSTMWDLFPWKCKENADVIDQYARNTTSEYSVGHWELDGFEFYKGIPSTGESMEFLDRYVVAVSGHYHTSSEKGNIKYVGTPYTLTMGDANDVRGFWVFDTDTRLFEFVANPNCWHYKVIYDSSFDVSTIKKYADRAVELIVNEYDEKLDAVMTQFESICNSFSHKQNYTFESDVEDEIEIKSVIKHIVDYIDGIDIDDAERIMAKEISIQLHREATASRG